MHLYFLLAKGALTFTIRSTAPYHPRAIAFLLRRNADHRCFPQLRSRNSGRTDTATITTNHSKTYQIYGTGHRNKVIVTTDTGHQLSTDIPKKMGGTDEAPQPIETLLAALIGCTQATANFVSRHMSPRLVLEKMEFDIFASRDERGALQLPIETLPELPSRLELVRGSVRVYAKDGQTISQERLTLLRDQTEARCPVANMMLASGCLLNISWIDGNA